MKNYKKICIVTMGNIYLVPYLANYTEKIENPVSIIYWDRDNINEGDKRNKLYRFHHKSKKKVDKIKGYLKYREFIKRILSENDFDVVIFLQTLGSLLVSDFLLCHYKRKYIIDVRDFTYENNWLIFTIEKKILQHSAMNVVSSEGFLNFLPKNVTYHIAHNIREWPRDSLEKIRNREKSRDKLHIVFVGYVNYQEQHKKLLLALKNDPRFQLSFMGTRGEELEPFCKKHNITNVNLVGTFKSEETLGFYKNADLVHNLYGNNTPVLDYALSNKLYYAATLNIPILVCEKTFMEEISHKYNFGITVDLDNTEHLGDYLYHSYNQMDWRKLDMGTENFLNHVYEQQYQFEKSLSDLLN